MLRHIGIGIVAILLTDTQQSNIQLRIESSLITDLAQLVGVNGGILLVKGDWTPVSISAGCRVDSRIGK